MEELVAALVHEGDDYYDARNGCPRDVNKAMACYRKAADYGYHWGYYNVGKCYLEGQGVPKDDDAARKWFRKASAMQNELAKVRLQELGEA
ncbi:MAG: hypothetical protein Q4F38_08215 [Akkermansia sp.]|nr:hypothetical protein [Akkermansia sp.]